MRDRSGKYKVRYIISKYLYVLIRKEGLAFEQRVIRRTETNFVKCKVNYTFGTANYTFSLINFTLWSITSIFFLIKPGISALR